MRLGGLAVASLVVLVAGCSATPDREDDVTDPPTTGDSGPPADEGRVDTVMNISYTGDPADTPWWTATYEVTAELGAVSEQAPGCDVAAPTGGAAALHVQIHNLNEQGRDRERNERPIPAPKVKTELVGQASQLVWVDPWGGCDDHISTDVINPRDPWEPMDVVTLEGYVLGVPVADPTGSGVRLSFEEQALEHREGEPVTLSLIY